MLSMAMFSHKMQVFRSTGVVVVIDANMRPAGQGLLLTKQTQQAGTLSRACPTKEVLEKVLQGTKIETHVIMQVYANDCVASHI